MNDNCIAYICQWGRNRKKTWSGTNYSLHEALKKQVNLEDFDIQSRPLTKLKLFLYKRCGITKYDFMYGDVVYFNNHIPRELEKSRICSIQFTELDLGENIHSYIYQDLCIDYVHNVILQDEELKRYYRQNVSDYVLRKRERKQRQYYESCKGIFVMGEWLKDYLIHEVGIDSNKVYCVGAGYDISFEKLTTNNRSSNKILFVGVDFERKGGYQLLKAFSVLRDKYQSNAELYVVGPRNISFDVEGVHFVGNISSDELIYYYGCCDVFCMPSYLEPYGKVYIEALCCGLPVLALKRYSAINIVDDGVTGYLLEDDDIMIMADKLFDLLHNQEIKNNVIARMDNNRQYYSWNSVAKRMLECIMKDDYFKEGSSE